MIGTVTTPSLTVWPVNAVGPVTRATFAPGVRTAHDREGRSVWEVEIRAVPSSAPHVKYMPAEDAWVAYLYRVTDDSNAIVLEVRRERGTVKPRPGEDPVSAAHRKAQEMIETTASSVATWRKLPPDDGECRTWYHARSGRTVNPRTVYRSLRDGRPVHAERHAVSQLPEPGPWAAAAEAADISDRIDAAAYATKSALAAHLEAEKRRVDLKADAGKQRFDLFPVGPLRSIVAALTYGAEKYPQDGGRGWAVSIGSDAPPDPTFRDRYYAAALRHLTAWRSGEVRDPESDLPHLAHAACCLIFLLAFDDGRRPWPTQIGREGYMKGAP